MISVINHDSSSRENSEVVMKFTQNYWWWKFPSWDNPTHLATSAPRDGQNAVEAIEHRMPWGSSLKHKRIAPNMEETGFFSKKKLHMIGVHIYVTAVGGFINYLELWNGIDPEWNLHVWAKPYSTKGSNRMVGWYSPAFVDFRTKTHHP